MKNKKVLIGTDTFHKDGTPHIMVTAIVCDSVDIREGKYNDVVGFYKYSQDEDGLSESIIVSMDDWAGILKKDIIYIVENKDKISAWAFEYNKGEVSYQKVQAFTSNDVNYDIWLDPETNFWNPVDFLLDGEYLYSPNNDSGVSDKLDIMIEKIEDLSEGIFELTNTIKKDFE